jgi:hypothetical protein
MAPDDHDPGWPGLALGNGLALEHGQLVAETARPVPRTTLTARARTGLWLLRVVVVLVSLMVVWTFIQQLR